MYIYLYIYTHVEGARSNAHRFSQTTAKRPGPRVLVCAPSNKVYTHTHTHIYIYIHIEEDMSNSHRVSQTTAKRPARARWCARPLTRCIHTHTHMYYM